MNLKPYINTIMIQIEKLEWKAKQLEIQNQNLRNKIKELEDEISTYKANQS